MAVYLVSYDLRMRRHYDELYAALETYPYCQILESCWLIDTDESPTDIVQYLWDAIDDPDGNDQIFVSEITTEWASCNCECDDWLNDPERSW
jgi:hypothetical protein